MNGDGKGKKIQETKIEKFIPDVRNANKGTERGLRLLDDSLRENGAGRSILVDRNGVVIAGNKTLERAADLGFKNVIVVQTDGKQLVAVQRTDLDLKRDKRARRLSLADNRVGEVDLSWDAKILADLLAEDEAILKGMFDADLLRKLTGGNGGPEDPGPQLDKAEELREKWGVESGQLWKLGEHRLICGDCTDKAVVVRVMGGDRQFTLVMTSPPYWVGKEYEQEKTWQEVLNFIQKASDIFASFTLESGRIVINTGTAQVGRFGDYTEMALLLDEWQRALREYGWLLRHPRIWSKRGGLGGLIGPQSDVVDVHWEFIGTFYKPHKPFIGQRRVDAVWANQGIWDDIQGNANQTGHCAAFPEEIPARNIRLYSDKGDFVFEPFSGSGTTLIACERLGRKCRAVEIHPPYVAVSIQRWVDMTGKEPELIDGQN